jgi:hypothetical protein
MRAQSGLYMIIAGQSAIQTVYSYGCGFAYELFGRINAPDSVKYFTALLNAVRGRLAHANRACPDHFLEPNPTPICLRHFPRSLVPGPSPTSGQSLAPVPTRRLPLLMPFTMMSLLSLHQMDGSINAVLFLFIPELFSQSSPFTLTFGPNMSGSG